MIWKPHVTVAAIIERNGEFLLVEEETDDGLRFNQPAGHLECGETLSAAIVREVLEETGHGFVPRSLVGIYHWHNAARDITYVRFTFAGEVTSHDATRKLDVGIVAARWLPLAQIQAMPEQLRSPMVMRGIDDYLAGNHFPLDLIADMS